MSTEKLEVVREAFDAWNARDMDRLRNLYAPDVVMRVDPDWPEPGPFVGRETLFEQLFRLRDAFDRDVLELVGDQLVHGDRVMVQAIWRGTGRGPESEMHMTVGYTVRGGLILDVEIFRDHRDALESWG